MPQNTPPRQPGSPALSGRARRLLRRFGRAVGWCRWYLREVTGENAYTHYARHARTHCPGQQMLSHREFERQRMERRTEGRCC
ncbi:CstA-like transporter-associated (seleno)protein [Streptomyces sp. NPDC004111]|uniref:CstA-like transporter-associated (seleno)protein n=1 Tax=Streptomyces sp. NPDC004111 TaxID=3364690 RepID=UPI0036B5B920